MVGSPIEGNTFNYRTETMVKLIATATLVASMSASAGFFDTFGDGSYKDNGFFGYNHNEMWEPRWYVKEADNFLNELDDKKGNKQDYSFPVSDQFRPDCG